MSAEVKLLGVKELDRALEQFGPELKKGARKATRKAARPVAETARARVPVDTGRLKRSIKVRALRRSRRNKHRVGVRVVTGKGFFQGETYYGGVIEYGAPARGVPAYPFMRPAHDENRDTVRRIFTLEFRKLIPEVARKVK